MLNKTIVQGRLVADPELKDTGSTKYCNFRVAWSEKYKDKETKLFLPCVAFSGRAEFVSKYFHKGSQIIVEGKMTTSEWTTDSGEKRSMNKLNVSDVHFCGKKEDNDRGGDGLDEVEPLDAVPW